MGFHSAACRMLLDLRRRGVSLERVATLGRQHMHVSSDELRSIFMERGLTVGHAVAGELLATHFAERFLSEMGAKLIESIDVSDYEGATRIWDLNEPITANMKGRYSLLVDGGALEHVFNFPVAIRNCMEMVEEGGHIFLITPTNNFMGHGFYQFSPELFFRVFSRENGYSIAAMYVVEAEPNGKTAFGVPWYEVRDPATVGARVELMNSRPAYLLVLARRDLVRELFARVPQQSDYVRMWDTGSRSAATPFLGWFKNHVVGPTARLLPERMIREYWAQRRMMRRFEHAAYRRIDPKDVGRE